MGFGAGSDSLCFGAAGEKSNHSDRSQCEYPVMTKICDINEAAKEKLPPKCSDKSGIGVHYTDAFIKPMNTKLPDGTRVSCKRKGLKITLAVGVKKGDGLMRRLEVSKDPIVMLSAALQEAAKAAGAELKITDRAAFLEAAASGA